MGAFGIYALVVTFIFVIYYVVIICMDLFGTKGEKKDNVEVIHAGIPAGNTAAVQEIKPNKIKEVGDGEYQIERDGENPEVYGGQTYSSVSNEKEEGKEKEEGNQQSPSPEQPPLSAKDIANEDDEQLAREAQAKVESLKEQLTPVSPTIQGSMYVDEFKEDYAAALLKGRKEDEQAEQLSF